MKKQNNYNGRNSQVIRLNILDDKFMDVDTGKVIVSSEPIILSAMAIGSCIAVVIYDRNRKIGGMAHVMLPGRSKADNKEKTKYTEDAIDILLDKANKVGVEIEDLELSIIGGANMLEDGQISKENIKSVISYLKKLGIEIKNKRIGGTKRRSVSLDIESGRILYTEGDSMKKELLTKSGKETKRMRVNNNKVGRGKSHRLIWIIVIIAAASLAAYYYGSLQEKQGKQSGALNKITIAVGSQPIGSLIYIADKKDYFRNQGLDVTLQMHTSGKAALNALINGNANLATTAETPIMHAVLSGNNITTLATIGTTNHGIAIVARKDMGISSPEDLRHKKIGVTFGTNGEFFMDSFLSFHGILKDEIEVVNLKPEDMTKAMAEGNIAAASTWNPHLMKLQKNLSQKGVSFYDKNIYTWTWNLVGMQKYVRKNPKTIKQLLRAIVNAEEFVRGNSDASQEIISGYLKMNIAQLSRVWDSINMKVILDQILLITLEDQTRWAIKSNLTSATEIPNYLEYIYCDALEEVEPEACRILHDGKR